MLEEDLHLSGQTHFQTHESRLQAVCRIRLQTVFKNRLKAELQPPPPAKSAPGTSRSDGRLFLARCCQPGVGVGFDGGVVGVVRRSGMSSRLYSPWDGSFTIAPG
jgi:hypothetical protein